MVNSRFVRCFSATCNFGEISRFFGVDFGVLFNFLCFFGWVLAGFVVKFRGLLRCGYATTSHPAGCEAKLRRKANFSSNSQKNSAKIPQIFSPQRL